MGFYLTDAAEKRSGVNLQDCTEGPFGETLKADGPQATINNFRFSTKYFDRETGLGNWGYRWYSLSLGRWLSRDRIGERGGVNLFAYVDNTSVNAIDRLGLYLVAFDGTGNNKDNGTPDTNVARLWRAYRKQKHYIPGVGSEWWSIPLGGLNGLGGNARIQNAWNDLVEHYKNMSDEQIKADPVDIIGFSRGAALARHFANVLYNRKDPRKYWVTMPPRVEGCPLPIRFLGIFDTVPSFGIPGNRLDIGFEFGIPPNVQNVRHAVSRDEQRDLFPLVRIAESTTAKEKMFPGVHSDVGGGYADNIDIQLGPLRWMYQQGVDAGVPWVEPPILRGWTQPQGALLGHQSDVRPLSDHPAASWSPVGPDDQLVRPDSWYQ